MKEAENFKKAINHFLPDDKFLRTFLKAFAIIAFLSAIFLAGKNSGIKPMQPVVQTMPTDYQIRYVAYDKSKDYIQQLLKAPATAKFPDGFKYNFDSSLHTITIYSYVDAQNSFGALLRRNWYCTVSYSNLSNDNTWHVSDGNLTDDGE